MPTSVLSDGTIRRLVEEGRIVIEPWDPGLVQPASVDLRLGDSFRVFHNHRAAAIDLRDPPTNLTEEVVVADGEPFVIHPGEFVLGRTLECVELPDDIVARIEGKSSIGRLGLIVHATAGFVDPGFKGTLTLEITNLTRIPIKLYAGLLIAQLSFMTLDAPAERPYGSRGAGLALPGPAGRDRVAATCGSLPPVLHALITVLAADRGRGDLARRSSTSPAACSPSSPWSISAIGITPARHVPGQRGPGARRHRRSPRCSCWSRWPAAIITG